ncbi:allantoicase [Dactylosporangium roseum]|uniref:Probable allantoicase n=1 Tax=Dactylosporangium roseum TaxID=47989 RepID=A0ABY5Z240_9ACTN|nr:allantoicase [Dactylosporangium roseum]UWZ34574.1 allantoicase [Dactylosporangium roseum]
MNDFRTYPDLASRDLAGSVVWASDELFAQRENLINPEPSVFSTDEFGHKGKVYDGWETRRRRDGGDRDQVIVRLGAPGVVRGVVVDTAWFTGNYPPHISVEATGLEGYPSTDELLSATWTTLVAKSPAHGDTENSYEVADRHRYTHVRLTIYPDGGVARFRVHGEAVPDPRLLTGTIDLAAQEHGGAIVDCSNRFYSSPDNLLLPGRARTMGEGWENARRRDDGNDHVTIRLAAVGAIRRVEIDTSYFVGNAPGEFRVVGIRDQAALEDPASWVPLVARRPALPDTRHLLAVDEQTPVRFVRVDVYPDGGLSRVRVFGEIDSAAHRTMVDEFADTLPASRS